MDKTHPHVRSLLIDTNIFLEFLLNQDRRKESLALMTLIERGEQSAFVLGFALHGIEVMLDRLKRPAVLEQFLVRVVQAEGLTVYPTSPEEEREVVPLTQHLSLDFDDALHYYVADSLGLVLVSFDHDFDHTDITRMEPSAILNS